MTWTNTREWVQDNVDKKLLPLFVNAYNHRYHRALGTSPFQAMKQNENNLFTKLYLAHIEYCCVRDSNYYSKMIKVTSTIADARHQEENPMRKKCLKAIVQVGHIICTSEWQMLSAILKANTV